VRREEMDGLIDFLADTTDPILYSILLFLYSIAATVALPIPVEAALFFNLNQNVFSKALMVAMGKAIGSVAVLWIGGGIGGLMESRLMTNNLSKLVINFCKWLVFKFHYIGLYIILSIPLMVDTVPLYLFSIFNEKGLMRPKPFAYVNFMAAINRVLIIMIVFEIWGIQIAA